MQGDTLTVERVLQWDGSKISWKYHGAALQCADFQPIREALQVKNRGKSAKAAYDAARTNQQYVDLPP